MENCCIRLVIYLNCTMMHGLANLKFKNYNKLYNITIYFYYIISYIYQ
jgi:hypothetical protein